MPGNPQKCRENAKCCLEMAQAARTQTVKETFEALARTWLRLATQFEDANSLLTKWSPSPRRQGTLVPAHCRYFEQING